MNYKLLHQTDQLQKFIDFLPDTKNNESYFLILIARKKWNPESGIASAIKLKREAMPKSKIIQWVKQLEIEVGGYVDYGKKGAERIVIPQDNLGVYIGYNPKDQFKACFDLVAESMSVLKEGRQDINVSSMARDVIQTSNGTKHFTDIDVDIKEGEDHVEIVNYIKLHVGEEHLTFVKTSGGFHCLIRLAGLKGKDGGGKWYQAILKHPFKSELNIIHHDLMPLVGCNQGKFIPHFL